MYNTKFMKYRDHKERRNNLLQDNATFTSTSDLETKISLWQTKTRMVEISRGFLGDRSQEAEVLK